jgi:L-ascorbate metabolism protein UlaG (beta-lactamase superfamily)
MRAQTDGGSGSRNHAREQALTVTYVGGPTALLEIGGLRLLTDPTFDPAGTQYQTAAYALRKTRGPAIAAKDIGGVDVVLLSHDHHFDNLDHAGRRALSLASSVVTTVAGAARLKQDAIGLVPWQSCEVLTRDGRVLRITATPARHGPDGGDRGPVIGFIVAFADERRPVVYISGDTVWYDGIAEVSRRFDPAVVLLFAGAACVPEVGPAPLTLTATDAVAAAHAFARATIVPMHFDGWAHFTETRAQIQQAFDAAGLSGRLHWAPPGLPVTLPD